MKKISHIIISVVFFILFASSFVFAEYKDIMKAAGDLYYIKNYEKALHLYKDALKEKPSPELEAFIVKLESKVNLAKKLAVVQPAKKETNENLTSQIVLLALDAIAIGTTTYFYMDYSSSADKYNSLFNAYDKTTDSNYQMLTAKKNEGQSKETLFIVGTSITSCLIVYTLADIFFVKYVFKKTKLTFNFKTTGINIAYTKEF